MASRVQRRFGIIAGTHQTIVQALRHSLNEKCRMTEHKSSTKGPKIAVLWRGDAEARRSATPQNNRFHRVFEELAAIGVDAEPAVYDEEFADEVRQQLLVVDGVLVWVDPIHQGKTRTALDPLLREVAAGPWVSAHPDVILQDGSEGSPLPDQASRVGHGHVRLP